MPKRLVVFGETGPCLLGTPIPQDIPVPHKTELHVLSLLEGRLRALCLLSCLPPRRISHMEDTGAEGRAEGLQSVQELNS